MTNVRTDGRTTVTVHGLPTGPAVVVSAHALGTTVAIATAEVDGILYSTAVSRGRTAVAVSAAGLLAASVTSSGATAVSVAARMQWSVSVRTDGVTVVALIHTPDLFGYGDEGLYDPNAVLPLPLGPPIKMGLDLRASCSVLPPPLVLS